MDKIFLKEQEKLALRRLESIANDGEPERKATAIVSGYLSSLLYPERFTDIQKEDLRRLALEFGYREATDFSTWIPTDASVDE